MKVLILANKCKWRSWDNKIKELKNWFKPAVDLEFTLEHVSFDSIPFEDYEKQSNGLMYRGVSKSWYDENISRKSFGYDFVIFVVNSRQWKAFGVEGIYTGNNLGVHEIQVKGKENSQYRFNGQTYPGDHFFNVARHELAHAIYADQNKRDNTHLWWGVGNMDQILNELKRTPIINTISNIISPPKKYKHFNQSEVDGLDESLVQKLDLMRESSGFPYKLTSTVRSTGNHSTGKAVDISCRGKKFFDIIKSIRDAGFTPSQTYGLAKVVLQKEKFEGDEQASIVREAIKQGIKRIGVYDKHAHVDTLTDGKVYPTIWYGKSE